MLEIADQTVKFGQRITPSVLEKSNQYAKDGLEQFPDNWRFYFDIGFNYYHEWAQLPGADSEKLRAKAKLNVVELPPAGPPTIAPPGQARSATPDQAPDS